MNPTDCEFLAENELIRIIPNFNEQAMHFICGDVGPFEAGVPMPVPLWLAVQLKKRHKCSIVPPTWLCVDEVKRLLMTESERSTFAPVPSCFFEIAHTLILNAKDDFEQLEQLKTLVKDLWDRREAKMRTSTMKFLSQRESSHAQLDNLTRMEVAHARTFITEATRQLERLNDNFHAMEQRQA